MPNPGAFNMQTIRQKQFSLDFILTRAILFGIIWGLLEVYLSPVIKSHARELFGIIMPFIIAMVILFGYNSVPRTGVITIMAVIAAVFEFFLAGMILHGAFLAILLEGLIAELTLLVFGLNLLSMISTGILLQIYSMFHPLLTKGVFCQSSHFLFFRRWLSDNFLSLSEQWTIFALLGVHILLGISAGLIVFFLIRNRNENYKKAGLLF